MLKEYKNKPGINDGSNAYQHVVYLLDESLLFYSHFSGIFHTADVTESQHTVYYVTDIMMYIANAVNLFLYIISGSRFRQHLKEIVLCKICRQN